MAVDEKKTHRQKGDKSKSDRDIYDARKLGIPSCLTVDELHFYRRRKPSDWLRQKDNLKLEEGSFKLLKSEYKRRFKNVYEALKSIGNGKEKGTILTVRPVRPPDFLLEEAPILESEYHRSYCHAEENLREPSGGIDAEQSDDAIPTRIAPSSESSRRRPRHLGRKPTVLKLEGDFSHVTEHAEKFIEYLLAKRAELLRKPTTLRLGGPMENSTETAERFIRYPITGRPPPCRRRSQLKLEGDLVVERREDFSVMTEASRRPPLVKAPTNLHLEGELSMLPEYRREYVQYEGVDRPGPSLPLDHLKVGGRFENLPEGDDVALHPFIPFLREDKRSDPGRSSRSSRRSSRRPSRRLSRSPMRYDNDAPNPTSSPRKSPGSPMRSPYDNPTSSPRRSPTTYYTKVDEPELPRSSPMGSPRGSSYSRTEGFPRVFSQPNITLTMASESDLSRSGVSMYSLGSARRRGDSESSGLAEEGFGSRRQVSRRGRQGGSRDRKELLYDSSKRGEEIVLYTKTQPTRSESDSTLDGRFECQPEYRRAYKDYLIKEKKSPLVPPRRRVLELANGFEKLELGNENSHSDDSSTQELQKLTKSDVPSSPKPSLGLPLSPRRSRSPSPVPDAKRASLIRPSGSSRSPSPTVIVPPSSSVPRMQEMSWEEDPAFVVLRDRVRSRSVRHDLYKEQKWMPSWSYSID